MRRRPVRAVGLGTSSSLISTCARPQASASPAHAVTARCHSFLTTRQVAFSFLGMGSSKNGNGEGDLVSREAVLELFKGFYGAMFNRQAAPALLKPFCDLPGELSVAEAGRRLEAAGPTKIVVSASRPDKHPEYLGWACASTLPEALAALLAEVEDAA